MLLLSWSWMCDGLRVNVSYSRPMGPGEGLSPRMIIPVSLLASNSGMLEYQH